MASKEDNSLTKRQRELLTYITEVIGNEHRVPSYREMAKALGVSAVGTIQDHIKVLVAKGYLAKEDRNIRLSDHRVASMLSVPIVGEVAAGSLHDAFEVAMGTLAISPEQLGGKASPEDFFALRVKGDSMVDAGIIEGDFVVVRKDARARNGDIVVASYNDEATVKEIRFPKKNTGEIELIPKNKRLKTIRVQADENFKVLGRVVAVQRFMVS